MNRQTQLAAFGRLLILWMICARNVLGTKSKPCKVYVITIEETYELGDAILDNDLVEVKKELGDLMLHLFFYAKIGSETKDFDIADVY
jgi:XTP/dITP diphosphohydrolase